MGCTESTSERRLTPLEARTVSETDVVFYQNERNTLGLKFSIRSGCLRVRFIEEGAISRWNATHPGQEVAAGDIVASVNGESGSLSRMLTGLHTVGQVRVCFQRIEDAAFMADTKLEAGGGALPGRPSRPSEPRGHETSRSAQRGNVQQRLGAPKGTQLVELPFVSAAALRDPTCCICLEEMEADVRVMELPCMHHFHLECAANWLSHKGCCPLCLQPVVEASQDEAQVPGELEDGTRLHLPQFREVRTLRPQEARRPSESPQAKEQGPQAIRI